jgi:hypothetical protein
MFKLFNLDLEFFNLAARFLICFASTASILKAGFTQFLETLYPRVDLLVAYMVRVRHVRSRDEEKEERHS